MMKLIIYTGTGEGKTCAAAGHALRALSHDLNVIVFQYLKPATDSEFTYLSSIGKLKFVKLSNITKLCDFSKTNYDNFHTCEISIKLFQTTYDLIIFDEINVLLSYNISRINTFLSFLKSKTGEDTIIIFTGRLNAAAFRNLYNNALIITEFIENKHEFNDNEFYTIIKGVDY